MIYIVTAETTWARKVYSLCSKAGLDCSAVCGECRVKCANMIALSDGADSLVDNDASEHWQTYLATC